MCGETAILEPGLGGRLVRQAESVGQFLVHEGEVAAGSVQAARLELQRSLRPRAEIGPPVAERNRFATGDAPDLWII